MRRLNFHSDIAFTFRDVHVLAWLQTMEIDNLPPLQRTAFEC